MLCSLRCATLEIHITTTVNILRIKFEFCTSAKVKVIYNNLEVNFEMKCLKRIKSSFSTSPNIFLH